MSELWSATLNPNSMNYATWLQILGNPRVPLRSAECGRAKVGDEEVDAYFLNLRALTLMQRARLLTAIAGRFEKTVAEIEAEIDRWDFPIRASDVIVAVSAKAAE